MDLLIILFLILLNGLFAMSEIAIVSSRDTRLQQSVDEGSIGAGVAQALAREPTRFLSTIQLGITLIGILNGAFGEQAIAVKLEHFFLSQAWSAEYAKPLAFAVMVVVITYLSLILGELVPKRLAMLNPESIARVVSRPMQWLAIAGSPLVKLLSLSTEGVIRLLGANQSTQPEVTEEEIKILMRKGSETGVLETTEHEMLKNVLRLGDVRAGNIMVLRDDILHLDLNDPAEVNRRKLVQDLHANLPVCRGGLNEILGFVRTRDVLSQVLDGRPFDLASLVQPPLRVERSLTALQVLERFQATRSYVAIVIDDFGRTVGLVTPNDVWQAIVGALPGETSTAELDFVQREDGSWLISGLLDVAKFKELLDLDDLPEEETAGYHTVAGFILNHFGHLPKESDVFDWEDLRFEVMDMDGNRVDKILVSRVERPAESED